jgi:hypothetical protein
MKTRHNATGDVMKTRTAPPLLFSCSLALSLLGALLGLFGAGCSSSDGLGNLLAGQACDAFSLQSDPRCACCSMLGGRCTSGETECAPEDASPSCGNRCPEGLACVKLMGQEKSVCGQPTECIGPTTQDCGNCGSQTRTCDSGEWSEWSECASEGDCAPGGSELCRGGSRTCSSSCTWGTCQQCSCSAGETQACAGGEQTCDGCQWGPCVQYACEAGDTQEQACGNCGSQTQTCTANHTWQTGACQGEGTCAAGEFAACGGGNYHTCTDKCAWGACAAVDCTPGDSESEDCGNCGSRTRDCVQGQWTAFGACKTAGVCAPKANQACGNGGSQTCSNACQWTACSGQKCDGSSVELCGNCGFHSRTCSNGTWSAYGACNGERDCLPGDEQACGAGMSQACGLDCYWGACL